MDSEEIEKIKKLTEEFLGKMTIDGFLVQVFAEKIAKETAGTGPEDVVKINLNLKEPQFLIGRDGQTLLDLQRVLRIILNKRLQKNFYLQLDINDYRKQKIEYLKSLARDLANEVSLTKQRKVLSPMPAYERRVIHEALAQRQDVVAESQGEGKERRIVISFFPTSLRH